MANTNAPRGLMPYKLNGQPKTSEYSIASAYNTSIGRGHVVELTGTGTNIQVAAAGNADSLGVFWGVRYVDGQGNQHFSSMWPASTAGSDIVAYVVPFDNPAQVFEVQCSSLAEGEVGMVADWHAGTIDTINGQSGLYLDQTTTGTSGASLKIIGLVPTVNNAYGAYAKAMVTVAESTFYGAGVGQ